MGQFSSQKVQESVVVDWKVRIEFRLHLCTFKQVIFNDPMERIAPLHLFYSTQVCLPFTSVWLPREHALPIIKTFLICIGYLESVNVFIRHALNSPGKQWPGHFATSSTYFVNELSWPQKRIILSHSEFYTQSGIENLSRAHLTTGEPERHKPTLDKLWLDKKLDCLPMDLMPGRGIPFRRLLMISQDSPRFVV